MVQRIRELLKNPRARLHGASRTDAGVSALGQAGLIVGDNPIPIENMVGALNDHLPRDIAIRDAEEPAEPFDLLGGVKSKLYRYTIYNGSIRPVLHIKHCWHLPLEPDIAAMEKAAGHILGRHDFRSLASPHD